MSTTPNPNDPIDIVASLLKGGHGIHGDDSTKPDDSASNVGADNAMAGFLALTREMTETQQQYMKQMTDFWSGGAVAGAFAKAPDAPHAKGGSGDDKRFAADAWQSDPRFDLIRRTYVAYSDFLQGAVEHAPVDDGTKQQMRFGMRQFVDATSPSNFFMTNPEAMQLAAETGGKSVVEGVNLFFEDLAKGRVSSTDEKAYEVGKDLATT